MPGRAFAVMILTLVPAVASAEPNVPTLEADILPILSSHCLPCHGGVHQKNGLDLRTLPTVFKGRAVGSRHHTREAG